MSSPVCRAAGPATSKSSSRYRCAGIYSGGRDQSTGRRTVPPHGDSRALVVSMSVKAVSVARGITRARPQVDGAVSVEDGDTASYPTVRPLHRAAPVGEVWPSVAGPCRQRERASILGQPEAYRSARRTLLSALGRSTVPAALTPRSSSITSTSRQPNSCAISCRLLQIVDSRGCGPPGPGLIGAHTRRRCA